jgi:hypothetical protein
MAKIVGSAGNPQGLQEFSAHSKGRAMPPETLATPFLQSGQGERRKRPDLTLGVFSADGSWKVYAQSGLQFGPASAFSSRQEALVAAEGRAFAAARAGRQVELFVEHEDGSLGLAKGWSR